MIGSCGIDCTKCGAFIATQNNDAALRAKIAKEWAELNNAPILPEHINCTGCSSDGPKFYYCENMCKIRKCSAEKGYTNCAGCESYTCDNLNEIFKFAPQAKEHLDSLR
ncbi:MAG TPA: DUF3795 domain-containing protein [Negativicutes bacterium]|nr:DUF3795 domain-containing protein [Negativicutes bacterium]